MPTVVDVEAGQIAGGVLSTKAVLEELNPILNLVQAHAHLEKSDVLLEWLKGHHRVATSSHGDSEIADVRA